MDEPIVFVDFVSYVNSFFVIVTSVVNPFLLCTCIKYLERLQSFMWTNL